MARDFSDGGEKKRAYVVASHIALFDVGSGRPRSDADQATETCDACGEPIEPNEDAFSFAGRGRYLWPRGDEHRAEEPPLCPSCAAAIGLTALRSFAIEDDEG